MIALPVNAFIVTNPHDGRVVRIDNISDLEKIKSFDFEFNIAQDIAVINLAYEQMRNALGVTNSWQGRPDSTADSGRAKEIQSAQSAGRLESRFAMKRSAWALIFENIFQLKLAYCDKPVYSIDRDGQGRNIYRKFNRYDFLEQLPNGDWVYNPAYDFEADTSQALLNPMSRWQMAMTQLQLTASIQDPELGLFFALELQDAHYPNAGRYVKLWQSRVERVQQAQSQQQQSDMQMKQEVNAAQVEMQNRAIDQKARDNMTKAQLEQQRLQLDKQKLLIESLKTSRN
ncbi:hypothetical protein FACS1894202_00870 [Clostridia bacterium]|nr:hypothetical protein FACS1894202_00870 [Clostridia bacterium]